MRNLVIVIVVIAVVSGLGAVVYNRASTSSSQATAGGASMRGGPPGGGDPGFGGMGRGGPGGMSFGPRPPMAVELMAANRRHVAEQLMVVGNLIGAATVEVVPKTQGRLASVFVRLGDPVARGQKMALIEDSEIREQVKQAEASFEVSGATVRQREADLKFAQTSLERSRNLYSRQILPKQSMDDSEAREQAAVAQLDLARAQFSQAKSRLDELRINLANTVIASPVDGFVGKRYLDPGASVSPNAPVASVVDIHFVRLVANLVERDLSRVSAGQPAEVEVDAYSGETFTGRVARVAPVLDPATRTAQIEVEVPNPGARLKPGMYARVRFTVAERGNALVVQRDSIVDFQGKRGVFVADGTTARFKEVATGLQQEDVVEVLKGISEGDSVITAGSAALRDGDRIILPGQEQAPGGNQPSAGGRGGPPTGGIRGRGATGRAGGRGIANSTSGDGQNQPSGRTQ